MFAYLNGTISSKEITGGPYDRVILDVAGVGFELTVCRKTLVAIGEIGSQVTVHTALSIRENDWTVFGFASSAEREMFGLVQSVNGVGPKLALALMGTLTPEQLVQAITADDHKLISQAPGVGPKVAQRLILELKTKIEDHQTRRGISSSKKEPARKTSFHEVRSVLEGLGYTPTEIHMALSQAETEQVEDDVEAMVRYSLKVLGVASR
ncbi:MAG: Holliday junction branch migration protein RuvA [Candidatus Melainabacteria bacterium]|nr:Holliday junction branch migration protein RuvA [Candidatus Melainabacteria bacterium]